MLTPMSADAGALTVTSNSYCAGDGAVIWYCADERPAGSTKLADCGRPTTAEVRAGFVLGPGAPLWFLPPPPVHPAASARTQQMAVIAALLVIPPNLGDRH